MLHSVCRCRVLLARHTPDHAWRRLHAHPAFRPAPHSPVGTECAPQSTRSAARPARVVCVGGGTGGCWHGRAVLAREGGCAAPPAHTPARASRPAKPAPHRTARRAHTTRGTPPGQTAAARTHPGARTIPRHRLACFREAVVWSLGRLRGLRNRGAWVSRLLPHDAPRGAGDPAADAHGDLHHLLDVHVAVVAGARHARGEGLSPPSSSRATLTAYRQMPRLARTAPP